MPPLLRRRASGDGRSSTDLKRPRLSPTTFSYSWQNTDAVDQDSTDINTDSSLPTIRLVDPVSSVPNESAESVRVQSASSIEPGQEQIVRTLHRSLARCESVFVYESHGDVIWLVPDSDDLNLPDTHAAGREIHVLPYFEIQPPSVTTPFYESPITRRINCRRFLRPDDIEAIREFFPDSVGVRILMTGYAIVLFRTFDAMKEAWRTKVIGELGGLRVGYDISQCHLSSATTASGLAISEHPNALRTSACLGLRLRMPNGDDVITTVTHQFVKCIELPSIFTAIASWCEHWYMNIRSAFQKFRPGKSSSTVPATVEKRASVGNTSVGAEVWLAGTDQKIFKVGTITKTYDLNPSRYLPYPAGYQHDLSLIMSPEPPRMTQPSNCPSIVGWGSYARVLEGGPIFVYRCNGTAEVSRQPDATLHRATSTYPAVIQGAEYFWDRGARTASLLWRTAHEMDTAEGFTGSVLCLGNLTDSTARAVVFQNYQAALRPKLIDSDDEPRLRFVHRATFKAGFLLPEEIRASQIVLDDHGQHRQGQSLNEDKFTADQPNSSTASPQSP
ncbi:hypothetical protein FQN55_006408 [Onygenales sp. PD_40]|nr:hypothetical protein FQN55_006408 [Onygenales sp. PD_40]